MYIITLDFKILFAYKKVKQKTPYKKIQKSHNLHITLEALSFANMQ